MAGIDMTLQLIGIDRGMGSLISSMTFALPRTALMGIWQYLNETGDKTNWYFHVTVGRPVRPIKRGPRGQMNRHWGHCDNIAEQLSDPAKGKHMTKEKVDHFLRVLAVREGLPTEYNELEDIVEPVHMSEMTVEWQNIVERVKQKWCDERSLWLIEYDETVKPPEPYRSVGGRTRAEMVEYWERWRREGVTV